MRTKVMKFGGSSVANAETIKAVFDIVSHENSESIFIVVSAQSGITDNLTQTISDPEMLNKIKGRLTNLISDLKLDPNLIQDLLKSLSIDLNKNLPSQEKQALVISYGERISATIISAFFNSQGFSNEVIDTSNFFITDSNFLNAQYDVSESKKHINNFLNASSHKNFIVTGFIASDSKGNVTTLGRGGSDLTATLLGQIVNAEEVEIWSDTNGIASADPRIISDTISLKKVSYDEAIELSSFGAKIIYARSLIPSIETDTPVLIKNTFNPKSPGTLISSSTEENTFSIATKKETSIITIYNPKMIGAVGYLSALFKRIEDLALSVDVVSVSEATVSFTISKLSKELIPNILENLSNLGRVTIEDDRATLAVISKHLNHKQNTLSHSIDILSKNNIDIDMISYGNSEINLTIVFKEKELEKATTLIHKEFLSYTR